MMMMRHQLTGLRERHEHDDQLPASVQYLWHVSLRVPESESGHEHPDDGDLIEQLTEQTEGAVEVDGPETDDHQKGPHDVDALSDAPGVRSEQVDEEGWYDEEQGIAELQRQRTQDEEQGIAELQRQRTHDEEQGIAELQWQITHDEEQGIAELQWQITHDEEQGIAELQRQIPSMMKNRALLSCNGK